MHLDPVIFIPLATASNFLRFIDPDSALDVESGFFRAMAIPLALP